jgi:hypothetical protein
MVQLEKRFFKKAIIQNVECKASAQAESFAVFEPFKLKSV